MAEVVTIATRQPKQSLDITDAIRGIVGAATIRNGLCHVMVLHTTAAVVLNETHDPNIGADVIDALDRAVPDHAGWLHDQIDDNAHAHIKAAVLGPSESIPVSDGELLLGTWQRIMLIEFDGPRKRQVSVQLIADRA